MPTLSLAREGNRIQSITALKRALAALVQPGGKVTASARDVKVDDVWIIPCDNRWFINFPIAENDRMYAGASPDQMRDAHRTVDAMAAEQLMAAGFSCYHPLHSFDDIHGCTHVSSQSGLYVVVQ